MQKQFEWLTSEETTRMLDEFKAQWLQENHELEEAEIYELVHLGLPHQADDEEEYDYE